MYREVLAVQVHTSSHIVSETRIGCCFVQSRKFRRSDAFVEGIFAYSGKKKIKSLVYFCNIYLFGIFLINCWKLRSSAVRQAERSMTRAQSLRRYYTIQKTLKHSKKKAYLQENLTKTACETLIVAIASMFCFDTTVKYHVPCIDIENHHQSIKYQSSNQSNQYYLERVWAIARRYFRPNWTSTSLTMIANCRIDFDLDLG